MDRTYPEVLKAEDITKLLPRQIPKADIYFGGFPCQDVSSAGQLKGLKGERSGLFYEVARLITANRPQWIVLENVPGLLSSGGREDFKSVLETLANSRYYVSWRVLNSQYFGLPQRRKRLFLVGHYRNWRNPTKVLFEFEAEGTYQTGFGGETDTFEGAGSFGDEDRNIYTIDFSFAFAQNKQIPIDTNINPTLTTRVRHAIVVENELRMITPIEAERLQGFPDDWTAGFSDTCRYRMLANAVSVPVAKWIGSRLLNVS